MEAPRNPKVLTALIDSDILNSLDYLEGWVDPDHDLIQQCSVSMTLVRFSTSLYNNKVRGWYLGYCKQTRLPILRYVESDDSTGAIELIKVCSYEAFRHMMAVHEELKRLSNIPPVA